MAMVFGAVGPSGMPLAAPAMAQQSECYARYSSSLGWLEVLACEAPSGSTGYFILQNTSEWRLKGCFRPQYANGSTGRECFGLLAGEELAPGAGERIECSFCGSEKYGRVVGVKDFNVTRVR
ncbi:hypothetical protein AAG614_15260 [Citromicrobium bathyomarinum]